MEARFSVPGKEQSRLKVTRTCIQTFNEASKRAEVLGFLLLTQIPHRAIVASVAGWRVGEGVGVCVLCKDVTVRGTQCLDKFPAGTLEPWNPGALLGS